MTTRLCLALTAVFALLLGGCGDDATDTATGGSTTTDAPSTSVVETTTATDDSTPAASSTTEPAVTTSQDTTCSPEPVGAVESTTSGDVDGDGSDDTVDLVHGGDGGWDLVARLADGTTAVGFVVADSDIAGADLLGVADVQGDGAGEIFVQIGTGASGAVVALLRVDGCAVLAIADPDGEAPSAFPVGSSRLEARGLQCGDDGTLVAYSASAEDGGTSFAVTWTAYALADGALVEADSGSGTASYGDELHTAASTFHCGTITYGA